MKFKNKILLSTKEIAEKLKIGNDVIRWHVTTFAEQDGLVKDVDYAIILFFYLKQELYGLHRKFKQKCMKVFVNY